MRARWARAESRRPAVTAALVVVLAVVGIGGRAGAAPLPVDYSYRSGIIAELRNPGGSLPGTNDFGCRPSAAHPRPVILLHGSGGGRQTNWGTIAPVLHNAGYCVFAPTYGALSGIWPSSAIGGMGPKVDSAWQIKLFAEQVLTSTGARQVDIVGHSMGTEIPTYWIKYLGGAGAVAHYVSLAPYWRQGPDSDDTRGETIAWFRDRLGLPGGPREPCPRCVAPPRDRSFNAAVRQPTPYVPGIRYTNIVTRDDQIVTPYTAGLLAGPPGIYVTNIVVQQGCSRDHADHLALTADPRAAALVLGALDPAHAPPVPCVAVAPAF
ncbi:lipase [Gordonia sp. ABSL1-1]|uniref:esterase/lipase family protein n=1 Tax=Gordonia sp. ABSL1-1 TaxID=3053923 RepID=UPI0025722E5B|nr:alpha/beta fold hydrolase [Gordonia sp. ABSL1-1]MDL9936005.1 lipase [Gordonia sp. ABSL1-1]